MPWMLPSPSALASALSSSSWQDVQSMLEHTTLEKVTSFTQAAMHYAPSNGAKGERYRKVDKTPWKNHGNGNIWN